MRAPVAGRSTNSPLVTLRPDNLRVTLISILCLCLASRPSLGLAHVIGWVLGTADELLVQLLAVANLRPAHLLLTTPLTSCPAVEGVTTVPFRHIA